MASHDLEDGIKRTLANMRREVARDLESLQELAGLAEVREELQDLEADLSRQLERVRGAAVVTLVGATGAGKSTLLNALVSQSIAVEGESRPTTRAPVVYRPVDADLSRLLADLPGEDPVVVDYEPELGGPWRDQILIDAPDINSVAEEHREVVRMLAARSDVLVVVAHRQSIAELSTVAFIDAFAGRRGMIFVLNRVDELTPEACSKLEEQVRELASERWRAPDAPVIATSARLAKTQAGAEGWRELTRHLYELVHVEVLGRVRRHNALGTAARIARVVQEQCPLIEEDLNALESAASAGLEGWNERIQHEASERLALRRVHVRELLWNEAARRWDGPGGWALRAGGLSSLGLGAGALLARRNPLLAAGAAVGAMAADRAREAIRNHRLTDASALLPGASELESWYREEMADARLIAARVAGSPTALGVPAGQALADEALAALGEAWEHLVERELLAAAEAGVRAPLRWAVDLPVWGFAGWIVWRAATGFLRESHLGMDLLIDAAILLAAWLVLARTGVRAFLGLRCRGLVTLVRERAAQALERSSRAELTNSRAALSRTREALERITALEERWGSRVQAPTARGGTNVT